MLINANVFNKENSLYCCDRCKKKIRINNRYAIYIGEGSRAIHKKWDLCSRCYKALVRGIEKGVNK